MSLLIDQFFSHSFHSNVSVILLITVSILFNMDLSLLSSLHLKLDTIVSYLSTNKHGGLGDLNRHRLFTCSVRRESDYSVIYSKSICSEIVNFGNVPFILNLLYSSKINVNDSLAFITDLFWERVTNHQASFSPKPYSMLKTVQDIQFNTTIIKQTNG